MYVENTDAICYRVSSLIITTNDGSEQVEVGWFDPEGAPVCGYPAGTTGPRAFWNVFIDGEDACATADRVAMGGRTDFKVTDPNNDGHWQMWVADPDEIAEVYTPGYASGIATTNGERHSDADYGYADFTGLQFQNSSGWTNYVGTTAFKDDDPAFCNVFYSSPTM